jgi:hypothetical protein
MSITIRPGPANRSVEASMALALLRLTMPGVRRLADAWHAPRRPRPERLPSSAAFLAVHSAARFRTIQQAVNDFTMSDEGRLASRIHHSQQAVRRAGFRLDVIILRAPTGFYGWNVLLRPCTVAPADMLAVLCPLHTMIGRYQLDSAAHGSGRGGSLFSR